VQVIEAYKRHLKAPARTRHHLQVLEDRCGACTPHFLKQITAEDLDNNDVENAEWAGEAKLLEGLAEELAELKPAHVQLPECGLAIRSPATATTGSPTFSSEAHFLPDSAT